MILIKFDTKTSILGTNIGSRGRKFSSGHEKLVPGMKSGIWGLDTIETVTITCILTIINDFTPKTHPPPNVVN